MADKKVDKLKVAFEKAEGYKIIAVSGVWGGVTPQGDVLVEFFVERREHPKSIELEVREGKGTEVSRSGGDQVIREVQFAALVRPDIAESIGRWLIEKGKSVSVLKAKSPDENVH